jgi:hypothetical protein
MTNEKQAEARFSLEITCPNCSHDWQERFNFNIKKFLAGQREDKMKEEITRLRLALEKIETWADKREIYASEITMDEDDLGLLYMYVHEALTPTQKVDET